MINNTQRSLPLTVDIYQNNAVIHVFSPISQEIITGLEQALTEIMGIKDFFYKKNSKEDFSLPESPHKIITQEEYGHKFLVNLTDYLDTGLFLDHRETRRWVGEQSRGKIMLNTFAYSGSFTVYAAGSGAAKTYSVDISRVYCEWIKQNLELNNLPPETNWVYKMDTLEFFRYALKKNLIFDIIIIDPPTFSKFKGKSFSVQKDHPELINAALEVLSPSGFILFSTNYQEFRMERHKIHPSSIREKMDTIPPDFQGMRSHRCYIIAKQG